MPRSAKRAAPVPTVSDGIINGCSDIYSLLADGLFSHIETTSSRDSKDNIILIATYRLLCSDMRRLVDEFIKTEFMRIVDTAMTLWEHACALKKIQKSPTPTTDQEMKERSDAHKASREKISRLEDAYKGRADKYFPATYVNASLMALSYQVAGASGLLTLHRTVSNFMAIARERCYAQSCTGTKNAANVTSLSTLSDNHTVVRFKDSHQVSRIITLYCRPDSFAKLCASWSMKSSSPNTEAKLALEMMRRRDVYSFSELPKDDDPYPFDQWSTSGIIIPIIPKTRNGAFAAFKDPWLVLHFHDIDLPSIQKKLSISESEVASCKEEIACKERQKEERRKKMRELESQILEHDINRAIARLKCGVADLEGAKAVFPGLVSLMRTALRQFYNYKATTNALDIHQVGVCFKELKTIMGPLRKFDHENYRSGVSSAEAYDFITGKALAAMDHDFTIRHFSTLIREGPSVFMATCAEYECSFGTTRKNNNWTRCHAVDTVCAAMKAFDLMENWELHPDENERRIGMLRFPFNTESSGIEWHEVHCHLILDKIDQCGRNMDFVDSVNNFAKRESLNVEISMPPSVDDNNMFNIWYTKTFHALVTEPQTRSIALWMCNIHPRELCFFIDREAKLRGYLQAHGVRI